MHTQNLTINKLETQKIVEMCYKIILKNLQLLLSEDQTPHNSISRHWRCHIYSDTRRRIRKPELFVGIRGFHEEG